MYQPVFTHSDSGSHHPLPAGGTTLLTLVLEHDSPLSGSVAESYGIRWPFWAHVPQGLESPKCPVKLQLCVFKISSQAAP